jgi:hypothetical protein
MFVFELLFSLLSFLSLIRSHAVFGVLLRAIRVFFLRSRISILLLLLPICRVKLSITSSLVSLSLLIGSACMLLAISISILLLSITDFSTTPAYSSSCISQLSLARTSSSLFLAPASTSIRIIPHLIIQLFFLLFLRLQYFLLNFLLLDLVAF